MIVQCPSCEARYRIGIENVPQQGGKISCPSCSQSFIVYPEIPDINDDETRAGGVPFVLQNEMDAEPEVEDGTVEIQNPMKTWLESQKEPRQNLEEDETSVLKLSDLPFNNDPFSSDDDYMDDKTEMINLGGFLELDSVGTESEENDATEVFTMADHEAETAAKQRAQNLPSPGTPKSTLLMHPQGLQKPAALPPLQRPSRLPALQPTPILPPVQSPSVHAPPIPTPSVHAPPIPTPPIPTPPIPTPPIPTPSIALPPISSLPPVTPARIEPVNALPLIGGQNSLSPPALTQVADPYKTTPPSSFNPTADLGVGQQNVQSDPNFNGPWKLRTNFGLTYEFPDTLSLNSWISSREDVSGYTLAGKGDFYPLSNFPQIRPKHAGTSGSFSAQQPTGLPPADFLNQAPAHNIAHIRDAPQVPIGQMGAPVNNIPMLQQHQPQPTDYKAFSKSDTNVSTKESGGVLPLIAWLVCGISGLMMVLTALYVFGIISANSFGLFVLVHRF